MPELSKSLEVEIVAPLARFSAPLSFWSHHRFMKADRFHPALRFAIVAVLLALLAVATGVDAASAAGDARTANAPIATAVEPAAALAANKGAAASSPLSAIRATRSLADATLVNIASCPVLESAPTATLNDITDPFSFLGNFTYFPKQYGQIDRQHSAWRVHYFDTWKFVEVGSDQYVLTMRGTTPPPKANFTAGAVLQLPSDDYDNTKTSTTIRSSVRFFTIPIDRLCVDETTSLPYVEMLGLREQIVAMPASPVPTSPCAVKSNFTDYDGAFSDSANRVPFVNSQCDMVLGSNGGGSQLETQRVQYALTLETSQLARAEWIKFIAAFFNREAAANAIFAGIKSRYLRYKDEAASQFTSGQKKPTMAFIQNYGKWRVATGGNRRSLAEDAGAILFTPPTPATGTGTFSNGVTTYESTAAFHAAMKAWTGGVDIIVDEIYYKNPATASAAIVYQKYGVNASVAADVEAFPWLKNQAVYRQDGLLGDAPGLAQDYLEDAEANADAALADYAQMVAAQLQTPNAARLAHQRIWLRRIARDEGVRYTGNQCPDAFINAPSTPYQLAEGGGASSDPAYMAACPDYLQRPQVIAQLEPNGTPVPTPDSEGTTTATSYSSSTGPAVPPGGGSVGGGASPAADAGLAGVLLAAIMLACKLAERM